MLATSEYPEVRALWCQSVFYLQRRHSAATPEDQRTCHSADVREQLELLGDANPEFVKFQAGEALSARDKERALQGLEQAWSRGRHDDVELALLLSEAQALNNQTAKAIATLSDVIQKQPELAKAQHALGNYYQADNKPDEAVKAYEAALKSDPSHLISAVELAAVEVLLRKEPAKGLEASERALDEKVRDQMGPAELARAHTLKGIALFQLFKLPEAEKELLGALENDKDSIVVKRYLASVLHAEHRYQDALPYFEAVTKALPKDLEAMAGHITTLTSLGKMEDAQKLVAEASKRFPNNARIEYLYGRIDEARDTNGSAVEHYASALKADPKLIEAQVALGRLELYLHHNDKAKQQFEDAATKAPDDATVRVGLGELALVENDTARAQKEFTRAVELNPSLADAHLGLSRLALMTGDMDTADKESARALELDPFTLKGGRLQRGTVLLRLGKLDDAAKELEQAKKEDPRSVGITTMLGAVYIDKGSAARDAKKDSEASDFFKEAEINLMLALKTEPSNAEANFYMAQGRAKRGEYTQAIENMRNAVDRAPKRADYHFAMGNIYRDAKQPSDALVEWQQTVALDPKKLEAYEAIGQLHLERNELDDAISAFQSVLKVDPQRSQALAAIGDAHFTATHWKDAVRSYEQALKADPALTTVFYKLGRSWSEQGQYAKAIDWYLKASTSTPDNSDTWYHMGYAYKEKGKKKDAVRCFQEYLTRKPDAQDRKEIEDEIQLHEVAGRPAPGVLFRAPGALLVLPVPPGVTTTRPRHAGSQERRAELRCGGRPAEVPRRQPGPRPLPEPLLGARGALRGDGGALRAPQPANEEMKKKAKEDPSGHRRPARRDARRSPRTSRRRRPGSRRWRRSSSRSCSSSPTCPHESVPDGRGAEDNVQVAQSGGTSRACPSPPKQHFEVGEKLGMLDFERAAKVSGSRFIFYKGGARPARARAGELHDRRAHRRRATWSCCRPTSSTARAMTGTGQLPKFEDDAFKTSGEPELFLIPTAEVPGHQLPRGRDPRGGAACPCATAPSPPASAPRRARRARTRAASSASTSSTRWSW